MEAKNYHVLGKRLAILTLISLALILGIFTDTAQAVWFGGDWYITVTGHTSVDLETTQSYNTRFEWPTSENI